MNRVLLTFVLPIVGVIVIFALIFSIFESDRIEHYNQYLIPMEGRIWTYAKTDTVLPFYFLDEKELSELAQKSNLKGIELVRKDGSRLVAKDWDTAQEGSFYNGSKYAAKKLSITISVEESSTFGGLILQYPDSEERFDIGSLQVKIIPENAYEPYLQIWSLISGEGRRPILSQKDELVDFKESLSYGVFAFTPARETKILDIDLGVRGLAVDPASLKKIPSDFDFGKNMTENPSYKAYLRIYKKAELGSTILNLKVRDAVTYLTRLMTSRKDLSELKMYIISPSFQCVDIESGEKFIYANTNYTTMGVQIMSDRLAGELLKKEGI